MNLLNILTILIPSKNFNKAAFKLHHGDETLENSE